MSSRQLILGTRNQKKAGELIELLAPFGLAVRTVGDFPQSIEVEETGNTFAENAALKATSQARQLGAWVLGEDSGLCVEALGDAPGVYSARYSGPNATDEANNDKLLRELGDLQRDRRTAYYVCSAALSSPAGIIRASSEGRCYGRILFARHGSSGFGYDPLFEVVEYHRTFGELGNAVKAVLSHRARAMRLILPRIVALAESGEW